jgi:streptomycin 6-kinase
MNLPTDFITNIRDSFGAAGERYLRALPALVSEAAQRWDLTAVSPVDNLSFNFVAFAQRGGAQVVLKIGVPNPELTSEIQALRLYAGRGACRLLESDPPRGMLLIERIRPGRMLAALPDDEQATEIAAEVMTRLWRPAPQGGEFLSLRAWFEALPKTRARFGGSAGPIPETLMSRAEGLVRELFSDGRPDVLLHGDFHHYNILESGSGWVVIDPKGVVGPAGYEAGPFLMNPFDLLDRPDPVRVTRRRIAVLAERTGVEPEYVQAWGIAHAALSACWCLEGDSGSFLDHSIRCGEIITGAGARAAEIP